MRAIYEGKQYTLKGRRRVRELLNTLNLNREEVLVIRGKELLTEDDWIEENDEVEIWNVISGG